MLHQSVINTIIYVIACIVIIIRDAGYSMQAILCMSTNMVRVVRILHKLRGHIFRKINEAGKPVSRPVAQTCDEGMFEEEAVWV